MNGLGIREIDWENLPLKGIWRQLVGTEFLKNIKIQEKNELLESADRPSADKTGEFRSIISEFARSIAFSCQRPKKKLIKKSKTKNLILSKKIT